MLSCKNARVAVAAMQAAITSGFSLISPRGLTPISPWQHKNIHGRWDPASTESEDRDPGRVLKDERERKNVGSADGRRQMSPRLSPPVGHMVANGNGGLSAPLSAGHSPCSDGTNKRPQVTGVAHTHTHTAGVIHPSPPPHRASFEASTRSAHIYTPPAVCKHLRWFLFFFPPLRDRGVFRPD